MTAVISSSIASPMPLATPVLFSAASPDATSTNLWYRFRFREQGGDYQIIRDYGPLSTLQWTAANHEGIYEMEVSIRDLSTGDQSATSSIFEFQSLVTSGQPAATPTANSLLFLYSAPACDSGSQMQVRFQASNLASQTTPFQACNSTTSMNFYLAGLRANTTYSAQSVLNNGSTTVNGSSVSFTTGSLPANLYTDNIVVPVNQSSADPILLGGPLGANSVANDLTGNVIWYGPPDPTFLTRAETGGVFWCILEAPGSDTTQQVVRKFDLSGMTLLETNAARVNEQLAALGKRQISGFHHEARTLADGSVAVLAAVEQILTDVQGPGAVDVLGDMIIVMDKNLNVVWTWDAFDNLNNSRQATLGETCPNAGCPAFYLAASANDWTHSNSIQETVDGNLLLSMRNQDWLIKINYNSGAGDGHIIWRMGVNGDFRNSLFRHLPLVLSSARR